MNHSTLSNRSINKALRSAGLTCTKVKNGEYTYATKSGEKVTVRGPSVHEKNTATTFKRICELLGCSIEDFALYARTCDGPETSHRVVANNVGEHLKAALDEAREATMADDYVRAAEKAKAAQARLDADASPVAEPEPAPRPEPVPEAIPPAKTKKMQDSPGTLADRKDLAAKYVHDQGQADLDQIADHVGVNKNYASVILSRLVRDQRVVRVKPGLYAPPSKEGVIVEKEPAKKEPVKKTVLRTTAKQEETVWEVLDLLFPNGIRVKHMPAVEKWKRTTMELLREVEGD